jgi:hypothetical protein
MDLNPRKLLSPLSFVLLIPSQKEDAPNKGGLALTWLWKLK